MSDVKGKNARRPGEEEPAPTTSFSCSVIGPSGQIGPFGIERELNRGVVVVHWTNRSIRSFDFLNMNDYSTAFKQKGIIKNEMSQVQFR